MAEHPTHATPYGAFAIGVKVGVAMGQVEWGIIRAQDNTRATFFFRGPAIDACAQAEHHAQTGDIILHPSAASLEGEGEGERYGKRVAGNGNRNRLASLPVTRQPVTLDPLPLDLQAAFFPRAIIEQTFSGEFRQAINVFVKIDRSPSEAQLDEFMQTVFRLQAKFGGLLNRLDFGDKGCHLLLFWGAPISHENDVLRALNFLLELQDQTRIPIRAGVTSRISHAGFIGSALHEEYTCYGNGVNLAARFMESAPPESIWVDEPINLRAAAHFDLEYEGDYTFKGFDEPQAVFALLGHEMSDVLDFYNRAMVGRQAELARLADFVQPLWATGDARFAGVMLVRGEAGIGKSRLLHEFRTADSGRQPQWFFCQTDQIVRQPLNPFCYWLREYFGQSPAQSEAHNKRVFSHKLTQIINATPSQAMKEELEHSRSILGALLDLYWDDSLYARLDPQSRYESTVGALKSLILAESLRQPVIIQLEDCHWLDAESAQFLERLARNIDPYPLAIIATARPDGAAPFLGAQIDYEVMDLTGLTADDLSAIAVEVLNGPPGPNLLALLAERADGNPFFADQILLYLRDESLLDLTVAGWEPRIKALNASPLPINVRAIFIARLDRLSYDVREVVQTAAVLGREFEVQILAHMLRHEALENEVELAAEAAIWSALTEMRYLFRHVLLRDAAYDMQVRTRRATLHQLAAQSLETLYANDLASHYDELAYHFEAACLLGDETLRSPARAYLTKAGEQTRANYENAAALDYFTRALALTPDDALTERFNLLLEREALYNIRGQRQPQISDLAELETLANALGDDSRRAEAALRRAEYHHATSDYPAAIAAAEQAVAYAVAADDVARQARGYAQWGDSLYRTADYAPARAQLDKGLALAQGTNAPELVATEASIYRVLGYMADELGDYAAARSYIERTLALLSVGGRPGRRDGCLQQPGDRRLQSQRQRHCPRRFRAGAGPVPQTGPPLGGGALPEQPGERGCCGRQVCGGARTPGAGGGRQPRDRQPRRRGPGAQQPGRHRQAARRLRRRPGSLRAGAGDCPRDRQPAAGVPGHVQPEPGAQPHRRLWQGAGIRGAGIGAGAGAWGAHKPGLCPDLPRRCAGGLGRVRRRQAGLRRSRGDVAGDRGRGDGAGGSRRRGAGAPGPG